MNPDKKALNRWARQAGHNDFDTYIRTGGSILDARQDIRIRISWLAKALNDLDTANGPTKIIEPGEQPRDPATVMGEANAEESDAPDPANAHIQGAEQ